jgi:hypothetical protein
MSETATEAPAPVEKPDTKPVAQAEAPAPEVADTEPKTFDADYVRKLRAEAAKYRSEAKDLAGKAKQFDDLQEAQKSELQKAQEAAAKAEQALQSAQQDALRSKVAAAKGLPASISDRLRGTTIEEMEADAVLAEINKQFVQKAAPGRDATGAGVAGNPANYDNMTPKQMVEAIRNRS